MLQIVEFGHRLQEERKRLQKTQAELAALVGVSRAAQATYEAGRTPPDVEYLARVCALGVDGVYLLTGQRAAEAAGDLLDWSLVADLLGGIADFAAEAKLTIDPAKQVALLRLLYKQSSAQGSVDRAYLVQLLKIAA